MTEETDEQVQRQLEARLVRNSRQWVELVDVFIEHFPTSTIDPALHEAMSIFNKFHCDKLSEFIWDSNKEIEKLQAKPNQIHKLTKQVSSKKISKFHFFIKNRLFIKVLSNKVIKQLFYKYKKLPKKMI